MARVTGYHHLTLSTDSEPPGQIGKAPVFPPWFKDREDELRAGLEQAEFA